MLPSSARRALPLATIALAALAVAPSAGAAIEYEVAPPPTTAASSGGSSGSSQPASSPAPDPFTEIVTGPGRRLATTERKMRIAFHFGSPQAGAGFECRLFRLGRRKAAKPSAAARVPRWRPCGSPQAYRVGPGRYRFEVRAVLGGVPDPTPVKRSLSIVHVRVRR